MKSQANQETQAKPGQKGQNSQHPPGLEGNQERNRDQGSHGQGAGQPKPGLDKGDKEENENQPNVPPEVPKREIERKPSDPQSEPPETAPKPEMPDKGPAKGPRQDIPESEENNDVEEQSPDITGEEPKKEDSSLVDSRDRFPFPNK